MRGSLSVFSGFARWPGTNEKNSDDDLPEEKRSVPAGVFTKCPACRAALLTADLEKNDNVCPQCEHHFPLSSARRIELVVDPGSFVEADGSIESVDPLELP